MSTYAKTTRTYKSEKGYIWEPTDPFLIGEGRGGGDFLFVWMLAQTFKFEIWLSQISLYAIKGNDDMDYVLFGMLYVLV